GPALSNGWIHRHQPEPSRRARRRLLQQARDVRAMDQGRQERHQVDATVMLLVRRQRRPASAPCAGLQSHKLHADAGSAGGSQAMVADEPPGKTREDRRQSGTPWPLRSLPDGRGRGAEGIVPGNLAADRRTATKAGSSVGTEGVGCVIMTGGGCLNDEEKHQIGGSNVAERIVIMSATVQW